MDFKGLRLGAYRLSRPGMAYRQTIDPLSCAATFSHSQPPPLTPGVLHNIIISKECHGLENVGKSHLQLQTCVVQYHKHETQGVTEPMK